MLQHIFNKYSITLCRILDKYMCDRSDHFSILQNRASTHALDHSSGEIKQFWIGHLKQNAFIFTVIIQFDNIDAIFLALSRDRGNNLGFPLFYLLF